MRGLFVTGTGTGVGKTIVSAALLAAMRSAGEPVCAHKPVVTGLAEPSTEWPPDHELLAAAAEMSPEDVAPLRFEPAVSPHLAAALANRPIDRADIVARARAGLTRDLAKSTRDLAGSTRDPAGSTHDPAGSTREPARSTHDPAESEGHSAGSTHTLIVEGVGGLLVPLADDFTVRDLAVELALPVIVAANPGLGTINHTLLTIEAARAVALTVVAVVLTPWSDRPSEMEQSNRETIGRLGAVEVAVLRRLTSFDIAELGAAGGGLPWPDWLL